MVLWKSLILSNIKCQVSDCRGTYFASKLKKKIHNSIFWKIHSLFLHRNDKKRSSMILSVKGKKRRINNEDWYKAMWFKATGSNRFHTQISFPVAFILNWFAKSSWAALNDNFCGELICREAKSTGSIHNSSLGQLSKNSITNSSVSDFLIRWFSFFTMLVLN